MKTTLDINDQLLADAKALVDDGVPIASLPLPVTPPKALN